MDNIIKDTRFEISNYLEEKATIGNTSLQREIENKGYILLNSDSDTVKIYSGQLAEILISNSLPAQNLDTKTETTINGLKYLYTFVEGYKEG
jgi:hypothetical protein